MRKSPLWLQRCTTEDYHCKCKVCKSAIDHANYLYEKALIDDIIDEKIERGLKHNSKRLSIALLGEMI